MASRLLAVTFIATLLIQCQSDEDLQSSLITGANHFGHELSAELFEDSRTNIWISPFSITSCFSLIYPGSVLTTKSQIAETLRYPTDSDSSAVTAEFLDLQSSIESFYNGSTMQYSWSGQRNSIIGIANKIFFAEDLVLKTSYINALDDGEGDSFVEEGFDFGTDNATEIINDWVYDNTAGLIDEIVSDGDDISDWRLAALNAIYLNATFQFQFEEYMTSLNPFYDDLSRRNAVADCHLMHQIDHFQYFEDGNYQFLKFSFHDDHNLFALFALPQNRDVYESDHGLISDWNVINEAINELEETYVALALPKLSIEASYALKEPLIEMGMVDAFSGSADFSAMTSNESLKIDSVIHKTMVEMDEKGLVAAAVTLISMVESAYPDMTTPPPPVLFKADHSFQLFIIDGEHENTVLFMGQINDPGIPEGSDTPTYDEANDAVWTALSDGNDRNSNRSEEIKEERDHISMIVVIVILIVSLGSLLIWYLTVHRKGEKKEDKEVKNFMNLGNDDELELGATANIQSQSMDEPVDEDASNTNLIQLGQNVH